jgi:hypothetical protein
VHLRHVRKNLFGRPKPRYLMLKKNAAQLDAWGSVRLGQLVPGQAAIAGR